MRRWIALTWLLTSLVHADASGALLARVEADHARGQDARAEQRLLAGLTRSPSSTLLLARYAQLALPCDGRATKAKASELLKRASRAEALTGLHVALAQALTSRHAESLATLREAAVRQDAESAQCARQIAALAIRDDDLAHATAALELANEVMPQDAEIRAELARVWIARGRTDRALPLLAERFTLATGDLQARRELAYALAADGRPDEALSLLRPARDACQQDARCALTAARIALEADRLDEAEAYLHLTLDDVDALFVLADVQTRARKLELARETYQRILQLRPDSVRASQALQALSR